MIKATYEGNKMIYIYSGRDDFSVNQALQELKLEMGEQSLLAVNTTVLEGQRITAEQLRNHTEATPFLAEKRLVILEGLFEKIASENKTGRRKKKVASGRKQDEYGAILQCTENIPESTVLVLIDRIDIDAKVQNKTPILKEIISRADVVRYFPLLKSGSLRSWIRDEVVRQGARISPPAADLLSGTIGSNLWIMQNEIKKLALYTSGRCIEEDDVREVVGFAREASVFTMVDAVIEFKTGLAERLLGELIERGASPVQLLFMISRQFRMIARMKGLRQQGKKDQEIQNKLGLISEFAFRKTKEQADRYPMARIREVYERLLAADIAIKSGRYQGETALNILVAELCE
jgi:DNA polymerase-3 subunit delta